MRPLLLRGLFMALVAILLVEWPVVATAGTAYTQTPVGKQAAADPRVVDRAMNDPEFFELAVNDPELAVVVAAANLPLPLPDDPRIVAIIRDSYRFVPPPMPEGAFSDGGQELSRVLPLARIPEGGLGTRTRVLKKDDPKQLEAEELLKAAPAPAQRIAHFKSFLEKNHFLGWQVDICDARTVDGVTTVPVQTYPLAEPQYGRWITMSSVVGETYEMREGKLTLVKIDTSRPVAYMIF